MPTALGGCLVSLSLSLTHHSFLQYSTVGCCIITAHCVWFLLHSTPFFKCVICYTRRFYPSVFVIHNNAQMYCLLSWHLLFMKSPACWEILHSSLLFPNNTRTVFKAIVALWQVTFWLTRWTKWLWGSGEDNKVANCLNLRCSGCVFKSTYSQLSLLGARCAGTVRPQSRWRRISALSVACKR